MNQTINSLWIGPGFSLLELLTMKSFLDHGYNFQLWVYNKDLANKVPEGVLIKDANLIIPENRIFSYQNKGDCRKGSYGGFSDLFRYCLLYKEGGIYVDMDVTCLNSFSFEEEYYIRPHKRFNTVGNILKAPKGCTFLRDCIKETENKVNQDNDNWVLPVVIFNEMVQKNNLDKYIVPIEYFGHDCPDQVQDMKTKRYYTYKNNLPKYAVHWCHEASYGRWNIAQRYNWHKPQPLTVYYCLLAKHGLVSTIDSV